MADTEKFIEDERGNKFHQKLKPYIVLQYLLRHSDEEHVITAPDIAAALDITYGIHAERRSIYRDINEINLVALMLEQGINLEEASKLLAEDEDDELKKRSGKTTEKIEADVYVTQTSLQKVRDAFLRMFR